MSFVANVWAVCLAAALLACARPGAGQQPAVAEGPRTLRFVGRTFTDSLVLADLVPADAAPSLLQFERCTFAGPVSFTRHAPEFAIFGPGAVFTDCTFEGALVADHTQFAGRLNFVKCRFKQKAWWQNCTFMAPVGMRTCSFDADASFVNTLFWREANFMESQFFGTGRFQSARWLASVHFGNAIFHKNADFTLTRFAETAWFDYAAFKAAADFGHARSQDKLSFFKSNHTRLLLDNLTAYGPLVLDHVTCPVPISATGARFWLGKPAGLP